MQKNVDLDIAQIVDGDNGLYLDTERLVALNEEFTEEEKEALEEQSIIDENGGFWFNKDDFVGRDKSTGEFVFVQGAVELRIALEKNKPSNFNMYI